MSHLQCLAWVALERVHLLEALPANLCAKESWHTRVHMQLHAVEQVPRSLPFVSQYAWISQMHMCLHAASGEVPAREGVLRLMDEARAAGLLVGVCSAATKSSAVCVVESLLGKERYEVSCTPIKA